MSRPKLSASEIAARALTGAAKKIAAAGEQSQEPNAKAAYLDAGLIVMECMFNDAPARKSKKAAEPKIAE